MKFIACIGASACFRMQLTQPIGLYQLFDENYVTFGVTLMQNL